MSDEEASFVTVGAIALHGCRLVHPELGQVVVVIGLGLIGQMAVSFLVAQGCQVVGVDVDPAKVQLALSRGAVAAGLSGKDDIDGMVRAVSKGYGADSVVITASSKGNDPLVLAGDVARDRAIVSVVGLLPLEIPRKSYYDKELSVVVSRSYGPGRYDADYEERGHDYPIGYVRWTERRNLEAVLFAISTGRLDVKSLITHRFPFDHALDAYALITGEKKEPFLGVVLQYPELPKIEPASVPTPSVRAPASGPVRIGLVGTGAFAIGTLLPALKKLPNASVELFTSGRGLTAQNARDRYGSGNVTGSFDAVINSDVQAVVIATRHDSHASMATRALLAGKDVFVEKPAALHEDELVALEDAAAKSGRVFMVGFNRRFSPFAREIQRTFAGRTSGLVMSARINAGAIPRGHWIVDPREGGGRIVGEGCHFIDLLSYWAGSAPVDVSAHFIGPDGGYEREDNVVIGLTFGDGSVATLTYTSQGDPSVSKERYEVFAEGKVAILDNFRTLTVTQRGKTKTTRALRQDKGHEEELREFVHACEARSTSPIPIETIAAVTRATFAVERARTSN